MKRHLGWNWFQYPICFNLSLLKIPLRLFKSDLDADESFRKFEMKEMKVLLADDEDEFVKTLAERIEMRDLKSEIAFDGESALEIMDAAPRMRQDFLFGARSYYVWRRELMKQIISFKTTLRAWTWGTCPHAGSSFASTGPETPAAIPRSWAAVPYGSFSP